VLVRCWTTANTHVLALESAGEGAGGSETSHVLVPKSASEGAGGSQTSHVLVPETESAGEVRVAARPAPCY
jgi:hypothetical protein